jgi:acyl-coenzyme A thioesterase PaaI-like protein
VSRPGDPNLGDPNPGDLDSVRVDSDSVDSDSVDSDSVDSDSVDSDSVDSDYDRHGGFPRLAPVDEPPGFGRFVAAMRRAQDLAVSAEMPDWNAAADRAEDLVAFLEPHRAPGGIGPAGRVSTLPGAGSLLMPPWEIHRFDTELVEAVVQFSRYHVGGNNAVHGGVISMMFDVTFGMVIHAIGRPISRTAFLHVDYRNVTPVDVPLTVRGWAAKVEGRKTFVNAELSDPDGGLIAEANGLMVRLLPGQQ